MCPASLTFAEAAVWRSYVVSSGQTYNETRIIIYEGWNFNSGNYLFTTDTK